MLASPLPSVETAGESTGSLMDRLESLRAIRGPFVPQFTSQVRDLIVIASSSRGGSSMLAETLRESRSLLHLSAEINPFLRLAGLAYPDSGTGSDRLDASHATGLSPGVRKMLDEELALDAGYGCETIDDEQFALDAAWRLALQWPDLDLDPEECAARMLCVLGRVRRDLGWQPGEALDVTRLLLELLLDLRAAGVGVNPWYYDVAQDRLLSAVPHLRAYGAPGDAVVEEPPFVLPRVWRRGDEGDLKTKALVVKTPSNSYRLDFLRALFPEARVSVVHLTRNPGASINGLFDGWRYHGFHAHRLAEPLEIDGYGEDCPTDRWWWKFDLPPGWQRFRSAPLLNVCALQWCAAHRAILDDAQRTNCEYIRVPFEDLISSPASRATCLKRLSDWLEIPFEGEFERAAIEGVRAVVATAPPEPGRWRCRAKAIRTVIGDDVRTTADELGYGAEDSWI